MRSECDHSKLSIELGALDRIDAYQILSRFVLYWSFRYNAQKIEVILCKESYSFYL